MRLSGLPAPAAVFCVCEIISPQNFTFSFFFLVRIPVKCHHGVHAHIIPLPPCSHGNRAVKEHAEEYERRLRTHGHMVHVELSGGDSHSLIQPGGQRGEMRWREKLGRVQKSWKRRVPWNSSEVIITGTRGSQWPNIFHRWQFFN